jgi:hypothetical protein
MEEKSGPGLVSEKPEACFHSLSRVERCSINREFK